MTPALKMAGLMAEQLRWAEINESWAYMASLLRTLKEMGARVIRLEDPRFKWRSDYLVYLHASEAHPGTF